MAMTSIRCSVLGAHVVRVTDLEGDVVRIICAEYEADGTCRLKKTALEEGPLGRLLERVSESALDTRSAACVLRGT